MRANAKAMLVKKTMTPKTRRLMSILFLIFLSLSILSLSFVLLSLPLERRDVWLKVISGVLAGMTVMVGFWAFITGEKLSDLQKERIATLENSTAGLEKETTKAKLAYLELQERVRKEQEARALLELVVTPREIDGRKFFDFVERLRPFAGTVVEVLATDEREPRGVAEMIAELLKHSGWKVTMLDPTKEYIGEGIHIHFTPDRPLAIIPVARELHGVLWANRIVTRNVPKAMPNQPPNSVRVLVGPPDTFQLRARNK